MYLLNSSVHTFANSNLTLMYCNCSALLITLSLSGCILADVLKHADRFCSGQQQCEFHVHNGDFEATTSSCPAYLKAYLEASYMCVKGKINNMTHKQWTVQLWLIRNTFIK